MSGKEKRPIIIKKVVKKAGGHHGGSWKVAYADFVTAMMAFFMVMWILGMDSEVRKAIEGYFSNPIGLEKGYSAGASPISSGNSPGAVKTQPIKLITRSYEEQQFRELAERIEVRLQGIQGLGAITAQVEIVITQQGLRIELVEGKEGDTFFALGSAQLRPAAHRILAAIAAELKQSGAPIVVEGHTDSAPFGTAGYSNWELSADRANAARRVLEASGLGSHRIREVRGYADMDLRNTDDPLDRSNRRTSILLPYSTATTEVPGTELITAPGAV